MASDLSGTMTSPTLSQASPITTTVMYVISYIAGASLLLGHVLGKFMVQDVNTIRFENYWLGNGYMSFQHVKV